MRVCGTIHAWNGKYGFKEARSLWNIERLWPAGKALSNLAVQADSRFCICERILKEHQRFWTEKSGIHAHTLSCSSALVKTFSYALRALPLNREVIAISEKIPRDPLQTQMLCNLVLLSRHTHGKRQKRQQRGRWSLSCTSASKVVDRLVSKRLLPYASQCVTLDAFTSSSKCNGPPPLRPLDCSFAPPPLLFHNSRGLHIPCHLPQHSLSTARPFSISAPKAAPLFTRYASKNTWKAQNL